MDRLNRHNRHVKQTFDESAFLEQFNDDNFLHLKNEKMSLDDIKSKLYIIYNHIWSLNTIINDNMFLYQADKVILTGEFLYQNINVINKYINIHGPDKIHNLIMENKKKDGYFPYIILEKMQTIFPTIIESYLNKHLIKNEKWFKNAFTYIFKNSWCDHYLFLIKYITTYKISDEAEYITNIDIAHHAIENDLLTNMGIIHLLENFNYSIDLINRLYLAGKLSPYNIIKPEDHSELFRHYYEINEECLFVKYLYYTCWYSNFKEQCKYLLELDNNIIGPFDKDESIALNYMIIGQWVNKLVISFELEMKNAVDNNLLPIILGDIYNIREIGLNSHIELVVDKFKEGGFEDFFLKFKI